MEIQPLDNNTIKFNTCKYRSEEPLKKLIKRCSCKGGNYTVEGYNCEARHIFQVSTEICNECPIYESK